MKASDYEDTIAAIQAEYEAGEFADDPEMAGIRRSRQQQEEIERKTKPKRETRASLTENTFIQQGIRTPAYGYSIAELELRGYAQSVGYQAARFCGPEGPLAVPCVRDNPTLFKALIDAWRLDPQAYLAELKRRGLVR